MNLNKFIARARWWSIRIRKQNLLMRRAGLKQMADTVGVQWKWWRSSEWNRENIRKAFGSYATASPESHAEFIGPKLIKINYVVDCIYVEQCGYSFDEVTDKLKAYTDKLAIGKGVFLSRVIQSTGLDVAFKSGNFEINPDEKAVFGSVRFE